MSEELVGRTPEAEKTHKEFLVRCRANLQEEDLREKIAVQLHTVDRASCRVICEDFPINDVWENLDEHWREHYRQLANPIISFIKQNYVRLAEDQSLPENPCRHRVPPPDRYWEGREHGYDWGQKDMLKAGFRRIEG